MPYSIDVFSLFLPIRSCLNQNVFSCMVINGTDGKPYQCSISYSKIAVAKGITLTQSPQGKKRKERGIQYVPVGYFTFLTLVMSLNKKPSAGCQGIRKCSKRFLKVTGEGG